MALPNCIMLIDDNKIDNFIHEKLLKRLNITNSIKFFLNGASALEHLHQEQDLGNDSPELIFVDIHMPIMDGFEFLTKYQEMKFTNSKKVIIIGLTTSNHARDIKRLSELDCHYILNKPLTEAALRNIFQELNQETSVN